MDNDDDKTGRPSSKGSAMASPLHMLFICSRNQWRSPTAEAVWRNVSGIQARSAGTSPKAKCTVSVNDIRWADMFFVMEKKHKNRLLAQFDRLLKHKPIYILDIPDEYQYMDPVLVVELKEKVDAIINRS